MNMYGPSMRKKEGMRQTDTKPLTRLITDEVEMINLHSTIWGTVQYANLYCKNSDKTTVYTAIIGKSTVVWCEKLQCFLAITELVL